MLWPTQSWLHLKEFHNILMGFGLVSRPAKPALKTLSRKRFKRLPFALNIDSEGGLFLFVETTVGLQNCQYIVAVFFKLFPFTFSPHGFWLLTLESSGVSFSIYSGDESITATFKFVYSICILSKRQVFDQLPVTLQIRPTNSDMPHIFYRIGICANFRFIESKWRKSLPSNLKNRWKCSHRNAFNPLIQSFSLNSFQWAIFRAHRNLQVDT